MTTEEAIRRFKSIKEGNIFLIHQPSEGVVTDYSLCDIAINALERQIPQEPIWEGDGYSGGEIVYDTWYCPCCDSSYEEDEKHKFCPECGQALKVGEEE